jgi:hypothetical protein
MLAVGRDHGLVKPLMRTWRRARGMLWLVSNRRNNQMFKIKAGILAVILAVGQPFGALARCGIEHPKRWGSFKYHK